MKLFAKSLVHYISTKTIYEQSNILPLSTLSKYHAAIFLYNVLHDSIHSNLVLQFSESIHYHNTRNKTTSSFLNLKLLLTELRA
ncbi:hypothetical protein C0J52_05124 [Blattella germanica]|nr:hypothetical protein C0J52_05124 [Blattella germanica]